MNPAEIRRRGIAWIAKMDSLKRLGLYKLKVTDEAVETISISDSWWAFSDDGNWWEVTGNRNWEAHAAGFALAVGDVTGEEGEVRRPQEMRTSDEKRK